jgi:SAM-dependent methyltransferase
VVADTWDRGDPYEQYMGRWSRRAAPDFLAWLDAAPGAHWLDVGCGTGALCATILEAAAPARVVGVDPAAGFLALASRVLAGRAEFAAGHAASLPHGDATFDVVVSGLVLNFVPDLGAAMAEMVRVTVPTGTVAAYVWDYAEKMEPLRWFWDVAADLDPAAIPLHEGARFPLCRPEALSAAFERAGLDDVAVRAIDVAARFDDFGAYWQPFLGRQGPAPAYVATLADADRDNLREALRARLSAAPDGALELTARAWAVRGVKRAA